MNLTPCPVIVLSDSGETCRVPGIEGAVWKTSWRQVGGASALLARPQRSKIVPVNPAATPATCNMGSTWCLLYQGGWLPLVWQVEVSRLLQKGQELVCFFQNNSLFCRRMRVRQRGDCPVCSWVCSASENVHVQFCLNALHTSVKIHLPHTPFFFFLFWLITWLASLAIDQIHLWSLLCIVLYSYGWLSCFNYTLGNSWWFLPRLVFFKLFVLSPQFSKNISLFFFFCPVCPSSTNLLAFFAYGHSLHGEGPHNFTFEWVETASDSLHRFSERATLRTSLLWPFQCW